MGVVRTLPISCRGEYEDQSQTYSKEKTTGGGELLNFFGETIFISYDTSINNIKEELTGGIFRHIKDSYVYLKSYLWTAYLFTYFNSLGTYRTSTLIPPTRTAVPSPI